MRKILIMLLKPIFLMDYIWRVFCLMNFFLELLFFYATYVHTNTSIILILIKTCLKTLKNLPRHFGMDCRKMQLYIVSCMYRD